MDESPHQSGYVQVNGIRLHYLDWGGDGPPLVFLAGLGCSAHIFDKFAPRFTDRFHVLALTRRGHGDSDYPDTGYDVGTLTEDVRQFLDVLGIEQVILAGHSMAGSELGRFAALYPERVLKLVFLDAAYDFGKLVVMLEKNPVLGIQPLSPEDGFESIEEMITHVKMARPDLAEIWSDLWDTEFRHSVITNTNGKVVDKMSDEIAKTLLDDLSVYASEHSRIQAATLSIFPIWDNDANFLPSYLTEEQKASATEFFQTIQVPSQRELIEQFRRDVPRAIVVEIPKGHHYCYIKHEELVYDAMREFLLEP